MKDLKELSSTHKALDTISRQAVDKIIDDLFENDNLQASPSVWHGLHMIKQLPSAQQWIPFETREPDAEEKEDHPEWEYVVCGNLPDDGQRILVNIKYKGHEAVQMDEYVDDGGDCYLDSGYDIGTEATAWMPLPEPYKGREDE